jgi:hypothetical protein
MSILGLSIKFGVLYSVGKLSLPVCESRRIRNPRRVVMTRCNYYSIKVLAQGYYREDESTITRCLPEKIRVALTHLAHRSAKSQSRQSIIYRS